MNRISFGKALKHHRANARLGQAELAAHVGISLTMISNYETGKNVPTLDRFVALCTVLGCTPDDLLRDVTNGAVDDPTRRRAFVPGVTTA